MFSARLPAQRRSSCRTVTRLEARNAAVRPVKMAPARVSGQGVGDDHVGAVAHGQRREWELPQFPRTSEAQDEIPRRLLDVKAADLEQMTDSLLIAQPPLEVSAFTAQLEQR